MDDLEVYSYVPAEDLDPFNIIEDTQVVVTNEEGGQDYLENVSVLKENDAVLVKGDSVITGDHSTYILQWDTEVGLWRV